MPYENLNEVSTTAKVTNEDIIRRIEQTERLMEEVKQLGYERTNELRTQIENVRSDTKDMVAAFQAARGAFLVLEWLAKAVKPILMLGAAAGTFMLYVKGLK